VRPIALGSATWNPWIKYTRLRIPVARRKAEPRICLEGFAKRRVQKARFLQAFQLLRGNLLLSGEASSTAFRLPCLQCLGLFWRNHTILGLGARECGERSWTKDWSRWLCRLIISGFLAQLGQRRISIIRHCTDEPSFWHRSRGFAICHLRARPTYPSA